MFTNYNNNSRKAIARSVGINKLLLFCALLTALIIGCSVQAHHYGAKIDSLQAISNMPYIPEYSGDTLFWNCVKDGLNIAPYLIENIDDSTLTNAPVPYFGGNYTVGDICYHILTEIIHGIPTLRIIEENWTEYDSSEAYYNYWKYVRQGNRTAFKHMIEKWYRQNKAKLEWVEDRNHYGHDKITENRRITHPAKGYYKIRTEN